jgi:small acid-soluble spore protein D (minor alpha/beta-type SASP)
MILSKGATVPDLYQMQGDVDKMARSSNQILNQNARGAMDKFKMEAASEVGVNLKQGYNGDLTSRQAGSIGGQMVKKMIQSYENSLGGQA